MDRTWRSRRSMGNESSLVPGVPPWISGAFYEWFNEAESWFEYRGVSRAELATEFDMLTRQTTPLANAVKSYYLGTAVGFRNDDDFSLDFADYLIAKLTEEGESDLLEELDNILQMGGSEWTVGTRDGFGALEKRVPDGVRAAGEKAMDADGDAGGLLGEAWHAVFGRNPDPEEAYEKAIKAVEAAAASIVLPNNSKATLGTIASAMRDQQDWRLPLGEDPRNPSADVVVSMVRALWSGQESRHGGNGYRKPSQEEAEAAVILAVALVQWFTSGIIVRRP